MNEGQVLIVQLFIHLAILALLALPARGTIFYLVFFVVFICNEARTFL